MIQKFLLFATLGAICALPAFADDDVDLRINGDFRGAAANAATAPGWMVSNGNGSTKIVRGNDFDEFGIEVNASAQSAKSVLSDFHPVAGNLLKIESEVKGSGVATVGFAAFDGAKNPLPGSAQSYQASPFWSKTKNYFNITNPDVKFVRIVLTAEKGAAVTFQDVEAEFKRTHAAPAGAPVPAAAQVVVPPAAAVASQAAAVTTQTAAATAQAAVATTQAALTAAAPAQMLIQNKLYSLGRLVDLTCQATVPLRGEIDFELEEEASEGLYWAISSYDPNICRVEMEHDRGGVWPFRYDKAEIDLKGVAPGTTTVVFTRPDGKTFRVLFTVR